MSSKNHILNAVKQVAIAPVPMPEIKVEARTDDLVGQFETNLKAVAGILHKEGGYDAVKAQIDKLTKEGSQVISLVDGIEGNREVPETTGHELQNIDFAVVKGQLGVAENGAIWVDIDKLGQRVIPFICENLILMIDADSIVPNMHEASKKVIHESGGFGAYIAGPSKTADIEQSLVVGAHGACSLNVYLL